MKGLAGMNLEGDRTFQLKFSDFLFEPPAKGTLPIRLQIKSPNNRYVVTNEY